MKISRVLALINSLDSAQKTLAKAFEIADIFSANVEVLYVKEEPIFDIEDLVNDSNFDIEATKKRLKELVDSFDAKDVAIFVKISDSASQAWELLRDDKSSLIVTPFSEISKDIAQKNNSMLYLIKESSNISKIALYFESIEDIEDYLELLRAISEQIELIYNYNYINYSDPVDPVLGAFSIDNQALLESQEELFDNLKKRYHLDGKMFINSINNDTDLITYLNNSASLVAISDFEDSLGLSPKESLEELKCDILIFTHN
jgi:hypothetical protein